MNFSRSFAIFGHWGGRAGGQLEHSLKTFSGKAALAADLIMADLENKTYVLIGDPPVVFYIDWGTAWQVRPNHGGLAL